MDRLYNWLILRSIKGLGERSIKKLWETFGSADAILNSDPEELESLLGSKRAEALIRREGVREGYVIGLLKRVEEEGISFLTLEDELYPKRLKDIPDPPPVLFYRGKLKQVPLFGLVGPRKPTGYSLIWTERFVVEGVKSGWGVVSGGALGIDSKAHMTAVENGGYTVCILGFGILKAADPLFRRIEKSNNVLISEFDPEEGGSKFTFPKRNRLIAAFSEFIVVPEAGAKSGALITANYARSYGRKVHVHIGMGSSQSWEGCYTLLKEGVADPVKGPEDVFDTSGEMDELAEFLKTPRSLEEIASFLGKGSGDALSLLTKLEMEGKIRRVGPFYTSC